MNKFCFSSYYIWILFVIFIFYPYILFLSSFQLLVLPILRAIDEAFVAFIVEFKYYFKQFIQDLRLDLTKSVYNNCKNKNIKEK